MQFGDETEAREGDAKADKVKGVLEGSSDVKLKLQREAVEWRGGASLAARAGRHSVARRRT